MGRGRHARKQVTQARPYRRACSVMVGILLLLGAAAALTFDQRTVRSSYVLVGEPALRDWGWHGELPYARRLAFTPDPGQGIAAARRQDGTPRGEVLGSYDPVDGQVLLREPDLRTMAGWGTVPQAVGGQEVWAATDTACLHEYGHALFADLCDRRWGTLAGEAAFAWLSEVREDGWKAWPLPAGLRDALREWRALPHPGTAYGSVVTDSLGEYLAESFSTYLREPGLVPPATRRLLEGLGSGS